ncbi:peptidoglycan-recognition protein LB [Culicoides brevitarsis]|uniref:peptidoglycan-recognition protein LB n=1 Tax=Culicoides brevitarsis TaxID=469753 RepID=UPI00307C9282
MSNKFLLFVSVFVLSNACSDNALPDNQSNSTVFSYVHRAGWNAAIPTVVEPFRGAAPYVIIHHSYLPGHCTTTAECIKAMQDMQKYHQEVQGWNDIGYSFGVGGDGLVYQGRGFNVVGAHAPKFNDKSVGICLIGDWRKSLPPKAMLQAVQDLIEYGVQNGNIEEDYKLLGHRQVRDTECPGERLFDEIKTWPHWAEEP